MESSTAVIVDNSSVSPYQNTSVVPPILPPRSSLIYAASQVPITKCMVEVEGYGPYKPVPPPKPLPQQPAQGCLTPPPYRMPPYPPYNEPNTSTALDGQAVPATNQQGGLQTHSNKFPIEREVVLSTTDKNSKQPILQDYKLRKPGTIAPETPVKQMAAWTSAGQAHQQHQVLNAEQPSPGYNHPHVEEGVYRATPHPGEYCATGTVPRQAWLQEVPPKSTQQQQVSVQIEGIKDSNSKDKNTMSKTYNTIKDIFSGRFKHSSSSKENDEAAQKDEVGLNNVAEELRRSQRNILEESQEPRLYSKPRTEQLHQYNQHLAVQQQQQQQQHLMMMQAQQYQQMKMQQHQQYQQHLVQSRSQEMLVARPDEQIFYHNAYGAAPQRSGNRLAPVGREQNYSQATSLAQQELVSKDNRRPPVGIERRSAQQIERDSQRQKNFESRRTTSQPQLVFDDEDQPEIVISHPQPQTAPVRRNSHGNLVDAQGPSQFPDEKDSDDGGFIKRQKEKEEDTPTLQGTPRKKLEGEIGKIEGVYNVGQRSVKNDDKKHPTGSAASSDYDKPGQSSSAADSGRGSAAYSSGRRPNGAESLAEDPLFQAMQYRNSTQQDSEWVDVVEHELRQILEPKLHELSLQGNGNITNSTMSESNSSVTPPLPPISPGDQSSPNATPRNSTRCKHSSLPYGSKPDYESYAKKSLKFPNEREPMGNSRWHNGAFQKQKSSKKSEAGSSIPTKQIFGPDTTDLTSTTTRSLDLESMLDAQTDSEGDISTTDARAIRKQLEGLETMYSEVLKLLGVKKYTGRYQQAEPRFSKRRYGSMSSLPSSSVSSRPIRDKRRANDDRKKVRDIRGINKRFQRLESHVVTLARSVAHLSSEMRTQHLMIQEMESIRSEIAALRTHTNMMNVKSQSASRAATAKELPSLANPTRVKKLTKFFGDEPPLLRLFLRKLGYEKYATFFENERIGMVELPYLTEDRLLKMGLPLGPRLRIMQEAQISVSKENTLCIV